LIPAQSKTVHHSGGSFCIAKTKKDTTKERKFNNRHTMSGCGQLTDGRKLTVSFLNC